VPCYQSAPEPVRISGHADERGTIDYNLSLAYRRALAVQTYLVGAGLPKGRLPVTSYGEEQPAESGSSEQVWSRNRRVELALD
jgi:peptidoglycan-associated lipoprotein